MKEKIKVKFNGVKIIAKAGFSSEIIFDYLYFRIIIATTKANFPPTDDDDAAAEQGGLHFCCHQAIWPAEEEEEGPDFC